jgi:hypothetical protein
MDLSARRLRAFEVASAKACAATGPTDLQPTILPAARKRELENGQADLARASAKREIRVENRPKDEIPGIVAGVPFPE